MTQIENQLRAISKPEREEYSAHLISLLNKSKRVYVEKDVLDRATTTLQIIKEISNGTN